jgi:hypothetical protein
MLKPVALINALLFAALLNKLPELLHNGFLT